MKRLGLTLLLVTAVATCLVVLARPGAQADPDLAVGFDTATDDNSATALGEIDNCLGNLSIDDTFTIDLYVQDVTDLCETAFIVGFDPSVVNLTSFSGPTNWFLGQVGSLPLDMSHSDPTIDMDAAEDYPNDAIAEGEDGTYWVMYGELGSCESGSGVLVRFGGVAVGTGTSVFSLTEQTTLAQVTPYLDDPSGAIGDIDTDDTYDGTIVNGIIAVGEGCPQDTDGDGILDPEDNCPNDYNPGQEDGDADDAGDACDPCIDDPDCDDDSLGLGDPLFFRDGVELFMGTDPLDACPDNPSHDAWPPDFTNDTRVNLADIGPLRNAFNSQEDDDNYTRRVDLTADGRINLADLAPLRAYFNTMCTP